MDCEKGDFMIKMGAMEENAHQIVMAMKRKDQRR